MSKENINKNIIIYNYVPYSSKVEITDGIIIKVYKEPNIGFYLCMGYPNQTCEYVFNNIEPSSQRNF
jgi:hypothetical protein